MGCTFRRATALSIHVLPSFVVIARDCFISILPFHPCVGITEWLPAAACSCSSGQRPVMALVRV
jgi:hypothetical protein